jgi:hypothetical protein
MAEAGEGCLEVALQTNEFEQPRHALGRISPREHGHRQPLECERDPESDYEERERPMDRGRAAEKDSAGEGELRRGSERPLWSVWLVAYPAESAAGNLEGFDIYFVLRASRRALHLDEVLERCDAYGISVEIHDVGVAA